MNKTNWDLSIEKRFWTKVDVPDNLVDDCWIWTSASTNGYGEFWFKNSKKAAHRLSYEYYNGPIPVDMIICHSCDNPICVNPNHLWLGTPLKNAQDKAIKKRAASGDQIFSYKFEDQIYIDILNKIKDGKIKRHSDLLKEKVSPRGIIAVLNGKIRHDVGKLFDLKLLKSKLRVQFTEKEVIQIKQRLKNGESVTSIWKSLNCSYSAISQIKNNKTFTHITI